MGKIEFLKDLTKARERFPFLESEAGKVKGYPYTLTDGFEVSDDEGNHWGTFRASVHFPETYPKGFPVMQDLSKAFPWEDDWHISPGNGECCVCGVIEKEEIAINGIAILGFIQNYVLPFYANQLYRQKYGEYKNGEYAHYGEGVWQALEEEFRTKDRVKIRRFFVEMSTKRGRNDVCFCGSGIKYKKCHMSRIKMIEDVINNNLHSC